MTNTGGMLHLVLKQSYKQYIEAGFGSVFLQAHSRANLKDTP